MIMTLFSNTLQYLKTPLAFILVSGLSLVACDELELPEAGSIADNTLPTANFSYAPNEADYLTINFSNQSNSATTYAWSFPGGENSTSADPSFTFAAEGTYEVSLTASDANGMSDSVTKQVEVVEPEITFTPVILNPGFDEPGEDSYRDHWRNSNLGGVIQITSSPVHEGAKASKFPSGGDRIAYQLITVLPDTDYRVNFHYTMKTSPPGTLTVAILGGDVNDPAAVAGATLNSVTLNDQSSSSTYVAASVTFNSGDHSEVAIFVSNQGVECRVDTFSIEQL